MKKNRKVYFVLILFFVAINNYAKKSSLTLSDEEILFSQLIELKRLAQDKQYELLNERIKYREQFEQYAIDTAVFMKGLATLQYQGHKFERYCYPQTFHTELGIEEYRICFDVEFVRDELEFRIEYSGFDEEGHNIESGVRIFMSLNANKQLKINQIAISG